MSYLGAWSVKGVDEQAKALAKRAASEAGVTMGVWLEAAIARVAQKQNGTAPNLPKIVGAAPVLPKSSALPAPTTSSSLTAQKIFGTTIMVGNPPANPAIAELQQAVVTMEERLSGDIVALAERLEVLEVVAPTFLSLTEKPDTIEESYSIAVTEATYTPPGTEYGAVWASLPGSVQGIANTPSSTNIAPKTGATQMVDVCIRAGILVALGVIAYLLGQQLGLGFSYSL